MDAEFGVPQWVFGMTTYGFQPDGTIIARYSQGGKWNLTRIDPKDAANTNLFRLPYSNISSVAIVVVPMAIVRIASLVRRRNPSRSLKLICRQAKARSSVAVRQ